MAKQIKTENVILESYGNIELLVTYTYEEVRQVEEGHGYHTMTYTDVDITYVELVIAGESLRVNGESNLTNSLTPKQRSEIESQLHIED